MAELPHRVAPPLHGITSINQLLNPCHSPPRHSFIDSLLQSLWLFPPITGSCEVLIHSRNLIRCPCSLQSIWQFCNNPNKCERNCFKYVVYTNRSQFIRFQMTYSSRVKLFMCAIKNSCVLKNTHWVGLSRHCLNTWKFFWLRKQAFDDRLPECESLLSLLLATRP